MRYIMERHASNFAYTGSILTSVFGGMTLNDVALAVGICTGFGTFAVNWYYKRKEFKLLEQRRAREL